MKHKNETQASREDKLSYAKEAWEGGVIGGLIIFFPLAMGIIDRVFDLSTIPVPQWIMISIGAVSAAIGMTPFILSFGVAVKGSGKLVTDGIYAHIRHPHYLSNMIWGFSFPFFFRSWWSLLGFLILMLPVYYLIKREEEKLLRKFGAEYQQYRIQVPMFLPRIKRRTDRREEVRHEVF